MVVALIGKEVRNVLEGEVKECLGKVEIKLVFEAWEYKYVWYCENYLVFIGLFFFLMFYVGAPILDVG
jgi:hypothetical protein